MPRPPDLRLPVEEALPDLEAALAGDAAAVLEAPPGAGKTTLVPLHLLDAPWLAGRKILLLEPRRLAARAAATRMAELLGEAPGGTMGYAMRFERKVGPSTRIEVVTEGLLTRRLQGDPDLEGVGLVIFDEFHERSLDADLGLALCLEVQGALRPDLKLLVMSATLDGAGIARHLGEARVIRSEGRMFPVRTEHLGGDPAEPLERRVGKAVQLALAATAGGVLVFLPGGAEIRRAAGLLAGKGAQVHALYGDLPKAQQEAAIRPAPPGQRKIVLATNIAETSLTIEGITAVVDSGLERRPRLSARTGMSRLVTLPIARASAEQRRGRAGRLAPGVCYRLWSAEEERGRAAHRPAEIEDADLAPLALELAVWGIRDPGELRFVTPPPTGAFAQATALLKELEALDPDGRVTPHGRAMAELPLHPRLAHMVLRGRALGMGGTALKLAALLSGRERGGADLAERVTAPLAGEAERVWRQLRRRLGEQGPVLAEEAGAATALAFPERVAQARGGSFRLANGRGARLEPGEALAKAPWLAVAEVDDAGTEGRIRLAAALRPDELERLFEGRLRKEEEVRFEPRDGSIVARRVTRLGALVLREQALDKPAPERVAAALADLVRASELRALPWTPAARSLQARVGFLRRQEPDAWPDLADPALLASLGDWLLPWLVSLRRPADLAGLDLAAILGARLDPEQRRRLARLAPETLPVPSGRQVALDYAADPPVLAVKLQELFGLATTPAVHGGRVPVMLQLLSPAQRPVAVTQDLAGFWQRTYPEVRKELRGRYPKHPWPDDPLTAPATARTKRAG